MDILILYSEKDLMRICKNYCNSRNFFWRIFYGFSGYHKRGEYFYLPKKAWREILTEFRNKGNGE